MELTILVIAGLSILGGLGFGIYNLLQKEGGESKEDKKLKKLYLPGAHLAGHYRNRMTKFLQRSLSETPFAPMYIGDSISEGWEAEGKGLLESLGIKARGIAGDTSYGVRKRLTNVVDYHGYNHINEQPSKIFLQIGENDLGYGANKELLDRLADIFNTVKTHLPNTKLYYVSIPPMNGVDFPHIAKIYNTSNDEINKMNNEIKKLVLKCGYTFIETNKYLKDETGKLKKDFSTDGLHLTREGYEIIYDRIKEYI